MPVSQNLSNQMQSGLKQVSACTPSTAHCGLFRLDATDHNVSHRAFPTLQRSLGKRHLSQPLPWKLGRKQALFIVQIILNCLRKSENKLRNITGIVVCFFFHILWKDIGTFFPFTTHYFLAFKLAPNTMMPSSKIGPSRLIIQ